MRPKYSIILPTLHGKQTLSVTLPAMLRMDRDDVEWVISENWSDDGTYQTIREIVADDDRVKLVRPPQRLPLGKHLEFAYQQAAGRWLSHIGDDDYLLPWRFDLLDQTLAEMGEGCSLIRGKYLRYSWPEYPETDAANSIDAATFDRSLQLVHGRDLAAGMLNHPHVYGGGSWVVRSDVVQQIRRRCGYFASPQHVEFFAMRAAAALSGQVALVGLPLFILGRHGKSSGTQYFRPKRANTQGTWDWNFEDPHRYTHCPFNWKSYNTLSLDAALAVQRSLPDELRDVTIDWTTWTKAIHSEMMKLVHYGQLPQTVQHDFLTAVATVPAGNALLWRWRTLRLALRSWLPFRAASEPLSEESVVSQNKIELPGRVVGELARFASITDVPRWLQDATGGAVSRLTISHPLGKAA